MSPRNSAAEAQRTRRRLIDRAADMASTEGLEGMTIGRLAAAAGLSKSGVVNHFPTKDQLQLETLDRAVERFTQAVWAPVADRPAGLERLNAICDGWTAYLSGDEFPGGCFITAASAEFDGRPGPVRDAVAAALRLWLRTLAHDVEVAVESGQLAPGTDPATVAFELNALAVAANQARQLLDDHRAPQRSRRLMSGVIARHAR